MGFWTKIRKPLVGAVIGGALGGPFGAVAGASVGGAVSIMDADKKAAKQKQGQQGQLEQQQAQITQLAQEKAIASESARLQEEEARKRTLFAGTALGETSERKKLLGL
jgi:hypothetical protein